MMGVKEADKNKGWVIVAQCMTLRTYDALLGFVSAFTCRSPYRFEWPWDSWIGSTRLTARVCKLSTVNPLSSFFVAPMMRLFTPPSPVAVRYVSHGKINDIYCKSGCVQSNHGPLLARYIAFRHQYMCHMSSREPGISWSQSVNQWIWTDVMSFELESLLRLGDGRQVKLKIVGMR